MHFRYVLWSTHTGPCHSLEVDILQRWRTGACLPRRVQGFPHIDGARALAATSILVYHVWRYGAAGEPSLGPPGQLMPHLALGVTLFFTLSGFLLYRPFAAALARGRPRPDLAAYLRNRALRILPAYWVILLVTGLVMGGTIVRHDLQRRSLAARPSLLVRDAFLVQNYDPGTILTGIGPAWSLAIEAAFYLALPILGLARDQGMLASSSSVTAFVANLAIVGTVSLVLSGLTYRVEELPALRWKARTRTRDEDASVVSAAPWNCRSSGPKDRRYHPETHQIGESTHG